MPHALCKRHIEVLIAGFENHQSCPRDTIARSREKRVVHITFCKISKFAYLIIY